MSDDIKRVLDKLDKIDSRQDEMALTLLTNTASLNEHMRRTDLLEEEVKTNRDDIVPLKKGYERLKGASWVISVIVAGILAAKTLGLL